MPHGRQSPISWRARGLPTAWRESRLERDRHGLGLPARPARRRRRGQAAVSLIMGDLFVSESARRSGAGRQLVEGCRREGRRIGARGWMWSTAKDNAPARALDESIGAQQPGMGGLPAGYLIVVATRRHGDRSPLHGLRGGRRRESESAPRRRNRAFPCRNCRRLARRPAARRCVQVVGEQQFVCAGFAFTLAMCGGER